MHDVNTINGERVRLNAATRSAQGPSHQSRSLVLYLVKVKVKHAQRGLGELRLLDFLTTALYGGRLSALRTDRLYPKDIPGTHFH